METDEKICPRCAETVKAAAKVCRHCGYDFETGEAPALGGAAPPESKTGGKAKKGCLIVLGVLAILWVIGAATADLDESGADAGLVEFGTDLQIPDQVGEPDALETSGLSGPARNALRSAEQYLSMSGFSRDGLIEQLSSDFGEGYDIADATAAVDSLNVNWNEEAAQSARQYLQMSGFSCSGLQEQLSSSSGDQYTAAQAAYGAQQAGAC